MIGAIEPKRRPVIIRKEQCALPVDGQSMVENAVFRERGDNQGPGVGPFLCRTLAHIRQISVVTCGVILVVVQPKSKNQMQSVVMIADHADIGLALDCTGAIL